MDDKYLLLYEETKKLKIHKFTEVLCNKNQKAREREYFTFQCPTNKERPNRVGFPKVWDVGEYKRRINIVCCQPWQDIFVRCIDYNEKIQSNWYEKKFTIFCGLAILKPLMNTWEMNVRPKINYMNAAIFVRRCQTDNVYKFSVTSKYGMRQDEKYWFDINKI